MASISYAHLGLRLPYCGESGPLLSDFIHDMHDTSFRSFGSVASYLILEQSEILVAWPRDIILSQLQQLGLRINLQKSVLSPSHFATA